MSGGDGGEDVSNADEELGFVFWGTELLICSSKRRVLSSCTEVMVKTSMKLLESDCKEPATFQYNVVLKTSGSFC